MMICAAIVLVIICTTGVLNVAEDPKRDRLGRGQETTVPLQEFLHLTDHENLQISRYAMVRWQSTEVFLLILR
jgi:hypothetical protein